MSENKNSVLDYLRSLDNEVTEVRIFCKEKYAFGDRRFTGSVCFGYYDRDHLDQLVLDIIPYDNCEKVQAICVTIQDIDTSLLARAENRIEMNADTGGTTSMKNVVNYTHFPVDIDFDRPAKISSSKEELDKSKDVAAYLVSDLFKNFKMHKAMSGNGYHIVLPIEPLPNTEENTTRWKRIGDIIAKDIIGKREGMAADTGVYTNPTLKLYGTNVRKGDSTESRPHRESKVKIEDYEKPNRFERLEELLLGHEDAKRYVPTKVFDRDISSGGNGTYKDLQEFLDKNNIDYETPKDTPEGKVFPMICVFDESHGRDAFAIQRSDGKWGWRCQHSSCEGKDWHAFREVVAPKQASNHSSTRGGSTRFQQFTENIIDKDSIDNSATEELASIEFPEKLMEGLPQVLMAACRDRKDIKPEFVHAVTFNNMGAVLGRRVFIEDDPVVYPNLYTVIVGTSGFSQKSQVTKLGKIVIKMADGNVLRLTSLATAEGLINIFVFPNRLYPGCNIPEDYEDFFNDLQKKDKLGIGRYCETFTDQHCNLMEIIKQTSPDEGLRVQLVQNELGALLKKSNKGSGAGLKETITELFDMEDMVTSPTKTDPTTAHFPCFSMIGSTTATWLETNIDVDDIHAGFINRFSFYMNNDIDLDSKRMFNPAIDKSLVQQTAKMIAAMRTEIDKAQAIFPKKTALTVDEEAIAFCEQWHSETIKKLTVIKNDIVRDSLSRFALHCKKYALLYSVFDNKLDDYVIHLNSMEKACMLASYNILIARQLFGDFSSSEIQKVEDLVFQKIRKSGTRGCTPREIANSTRRASIEQVQRCIDSLERAHFIGKRAIPYNKGYFKWHALKDLNLDELEDEEDV